MHQNANSLTSIQPYVIGIAGGSGAGKTTLAEAITESIGEEYVVVIKHDSYYRDLSDIPLQDRLQTDFDDPAALDTELLILHLRQLRSGHTVEVPQYDFVTCTRLSETIQVEPRPAIIIEGVLIFVDAKLRDALDVKLFVDLEADERFMRRLSRDLKERGRTPDSVIAQYRATVRPNHNRFVEPSKKFADFVVYGEHIREEVVKAVSGLVLSKIEAAQNATEATRTIRALDKLRNVGNSLLSSQEDEKALLEALAWNAHDIMQASEVALFQYDSTGNKFINLVVWPAQRALEEPREEGGITAEVFRRGSWFVRDRSELEPKYTASLPEYVKAFIGVLLKMNGETLGVLFFNFREPREFTTSDEIITNLLGIYATIVLQGTRVRSQFKQIGIIGQRLFSNNEVEGVTPDDVVRDGLEVVALELRADEGALHQYDARKGKFTRSIVWPAQRALEEPREEGGITAEVFRRGSWFVRDRSELEPKYTASLPEYVKAFIGVLLKMNGETLGVLFFNFREPREFRQSDEAIAMTLSSQMSAAILIERLIEQNLDKEREKTQAERERANAEDAMHIVAGDVAHFAKNRVGFIKVASMLLQERLRAGNTEGSLDKLQEIYEVADNVVEELEAALVIDTRLPILETLAAREIIDYALSRISADFPSHIAFNVELPEDLPYIHVDRMRTSQALIGLIINAKEAIERADKAQGKIEVSARLSDDTKFVYILLTDNGHGIPTGKWEDIFQGTRFDPGGRLRRGSGSGLWIARSLIKAQGGDVFVQESMDEKTVFAVALPTRTSQD